MSLQGEYEGGTRALRVRSTTVVAVLRDGNVAVAADGQVTLGETVMKQSAEKVRRIAKGRALVGLRAASLMP
jgi:ATP-dependent HslUV protease subunit HslV